ncbi:MAG TPA: CARDB domain-containing protein [Thermoplasmata archaeon]|nr:CARDB domain-containing protein [Thermoplasmata archaeon]
MRSVLFALAVLVALAAFVPVSGRVDGQSVFGSIAGPTALAPRQSATYNVTIIGGPETPPVNYSLDFYLDGADLTGGSPTKAAPQTTSGSQTTIRIDVTAPEGDQVVILVVRISAQSGDVVVKGTADLSIQVLTPIILRATFRNDASTSALNVTVRFYVDDELVGTRSIARLNGSASQTVNMNYLPVGIAAGAHSVRVEADLDRDGVIDGARGEIVLSDFFIQESASLSEGWNLIIGIAVFLIVFVIAAAARRRRT